MVKPSAPLARRKASANNRPMAQTVAIIDYGSGNLRSVAKAVERAAGAGGVQTSVCVTDEPSEILAADRLILPGVGAFGACMSGLAAREGVLEALEHRVLIDHRPFLGICVGMQLLAEQGLEFGSHQGLGWIPGKVESLALPGKIRTPHMGWNSVEGRAPHRLFDAAAGQDFYFAHSYHFVAENDAHIIGVTVHGATLAAAICRDNIFGVQFHPEKSQKAGLALLEGFLTWSPA